MHNVKENPARLYLPLLTSANPEVRHQAFLIMASHHGRQAPAYLHGLLEDPEIETRNEAQVALQLLKEAGEAGVAPEPRGRLYIECLGRFRLQRGGREISHDDWLRHCEGRAGVQKAQSLLAYLIHCGRRGASRATLDSVIWARRGGAGRLSRTLSALKAVLGDAGVPAPDGGLIISADHCALDPELYTSDDQSFERIFTIASEVELSQGLEAAAPFYRQAIQTYGGPYMVNIAGSLPWARARRDLLAGNFIIASERLAELAFQQRRYWQCIELCQAALEADRGAEELLCWLLRAHHALGQRADLEHSYRLYLRTLPADWDDSAARHDIVSITYRELTSPLRERAVGAG